MTGLDMRKAVPKPSIAPDMSKMYRSSPLRSTLNTQVWTCVKYVLNEAIHRFGHV